MRNYAARCEAQSPGSNRMKHDAAVFNYYYTSLHVGCPKVSVIHGNWNLGQKNRGLHAHAAGHTHLNLILPGGSQDFSRLPWIPSLAFHICCSNFSRCLTVGVKFAKK